MRFGPTTHRRHLDAVLHLRTEQRLSGPQIAERLNLPLTWVTYQLQKFDLNARISIVASSENLARAAELRAQGVRWKVIAKQLGVEKWESLARAVYVSNR